MDDIFEISIKLKVDVTTNIVPPKEFHSRFPLVEVLTPQYP